MFNVKYNSTLFACVAAMALTTGCANHAKPTTTTIVEAPAATVENNDVLPTANPDQVPPVPTAVPVASNFSSEWDGLRTTYVAGGFRDAVELTDRGDLHEELDPSGCALPTPAIRFVPATYAKAMTTAFQNLAAGGESTDTREQRVRSTFQGVFSNLSTRILRLQSILTPAQTCERARLEALKTALAATLILRTIELWNSGIAPMPGPIPHPNPNPNPNPGPNPPAPGPHPHPNPNPHPPAPVPPMPAPEDQGLFRSDNNS